jgi:hypothetical protein
VFEWGTNNAKKTNNEFNILLIAIKILK